MTQVVVYTKDACPFCDQAKALLESKDQPYTTIKLGRDITREDLMEQFPDARTMPIIVIDGVRIGGFTELKKYYAGE